MHLLTARRITACLAAASLTAVLTGCTAADPGTQPAPPTNPAAAAPLGTAPAAQEPQTVEAARALLDKALGRGSAGDHAGLWDLLIPEDQALISRDDYVAYQETCNADAPVGAPYEITDVRLEGPDAAVGIAKVLGFSFAVEAFYRDGRWLTTLTDENRAGVEYWNVNGGCRPDAA